MTLHLSQIEISSFLATGVIVTVTTEYDRALTRLGLLSPG
jgi:hypothetical protein